MSKTITISKEKAQQYMDNWATTMGGATTTISKEYFYQGTQIICGYKMPIADYFYLLNNIGTKSFQVFFGLDEQKKVRLIIWADNGGLTTRKYYSPTETILIEDPSDKGAPPLVMPHEVSEEMTAYLRREWVAALQSRTNPISQKLFQVKFSGEVDALRGYSFGPDVFENVLLLDTAGRVRNPGKKLQLETINFYLANHKYGEEESEGSIGVLMQGQGVLRNHTDVVSEEENDDVFNTGNFDFSAPCPPACP